MKIPLRELRYLVRSAASQETSVNPDRWSPENPLFGHCAAAALVVQDFYGGKIRRVFLPEEWAKTLGYRSHYWNVFEGGGEVDFSSDQFPEGFPYETLLGRIAMSDTSDESDERSHLLESPETQARYHLLEERVWVLLHSNSLFQDERFQRCWEYAFSERAKCAKMRFACLVYRGDALVTADINRLITEQFGKERFCALDGSRCIRLNKESRVDPSLGDCGHAPIWCLRNVFELGYKPRDLSSLDFYEAGFFPDGSPWWRGEASYTCIYCQNIFAMLGLDKIWSAFGGRWHPLPTRVSFYSSADYALGSKKA